MNQKIVFFLFVLISAKAFSQSQESLIWSKDGQSFYSIQNGDIVMQTPGNANTTKWINGKLLIPNGAKSPIEIQKFSLSVNQELVLIQTHSKKVWRYETMGDFYIFNTKTNQLQQIGKGLPAASLQFAKISPNNQWVAYVSEHNIYAEDWVSGKKVKLTTDGTKYLINGTFDWVYEEEFFCRDGFRWSPDSKHIAYWQVDANGVKNYLMINNTDAAYPFAVPVEYPIAGEKPSKVKIGVVDLMSKKTKYLILSICIIVVLYIANYQRGTRFEWILIIPTIYLMYFLFTQLSTILLIGYYKLKNKINRRKL